jgi:TonB family protein
VSLGVDASIHPYRDFTKRRFRRYPVAVPVDVVVLRSGIPATIPGRSLDVSEGGLATALAGELRPGESVGVDFQLPFVLGAIQAKAVVRHSALMRCGLQFIAMPPEQETALRTWTKMADDSVAPSHEPVPSLSPESHFQPVSMPPVVTPAAAVKPRPRRWFVPVLTVFVLVLALTGWWAWRGGPNDGDDDLATAANSQTPRVDVPGPFMAQKLVHRVEPIYPADALKQNVQGLVVLDTIINDDGSVGEVRPISGPAELYQSAVDAVKWWRFDPYRLNGQPVQAHTTVQVDFRITR